MLFKHKEDRAYSKARLSQPKPGRHKNSVPPGRDLDIIKKIPSKAIHQAVKVFRRRWPDAEEYIMTSPEHAVRYFKAFKKDFKDNRWPEAETFIKKNPAWWAEYEKQISTTEQRSIPRSTDKE